MTQASTTPLWRAAIAPQVLRAVGSWMVLVLLPVGLAAALTSRCTEQANTKMVLQQVALSDLQRFQASGGALDNSVRTLVEASLDNGKLDDARSAIRSAVAQHSADTLAARQTLGASHADAYLIELAELRNRTDRLNDVMGGRPVWEQTARIVKARQDMVSEAAKRTAKL